MNKIIYLVLIMVLALFLAGCASKTKIVSQIVDNNQVEQKIKIGVVLPLTGEYALYGQSAKNGIELALDKIKHRINNKEVELIYEDSLLSPQKATTAVQKLINIDDVDIILGEVSSSVTLAMCSVTKQNNIVLFTPVASADSITTNCGDKTFRIWSPDSFQGVKMVEIANNLGLKKGAILFINNDYGLNLKNVIKQKFEELDGEILITERFESAAKDFRTQLLKIKSKSPDVIFLPSYVKESSLILNQAKELGINAQFISSESAKDPTLFEVAEENAEGLIITYIKANKDAEYLEFESKFKNKHNQEPTIFSDYAYDTMLITADSLEKCDDKNDLTSNCIANEFYKLRHFPGATGKTTFDENGNVQKPFTSYIVKNKEFVEFG